uniref:Secreted protein n=1 Tax=Trichobilharzia regenti TaxID=157069 RepID=A0AA85JV56_TRIRE|nr:unnamed protein product [Trichobilharzia regenti]
MRFILATFMLISFSVYLSLGVPTVGLPTVDVQSTPCEINMIKKIQELILASSGQDVTMIKGFLEKDNLEQQIQGLIATLIKRLDEGLGGLVSTGGMTPAS